MANTVDMTAGSAGRKWERRKRRRELILLVLMFLFVYLLIVSVSLRLRLREQKKELVVINEQIEEARIENDELTRIMQGTEDEYIERIAREKLGYAAVGDRVYEDISGVD